ncbi:hypothetical protein FQR65_LT04185 [Abscondita terminalis]|nr:hypothetical protein FQR65_LT04185 [Abscondita terminalis]
MQLDIPVVDSTELGFAWVTLATNDSYALGAMVLAHSLKQVGTVHQLAVLVTPGVTGVMREKLSTVFNVVKEVNILDSKDEANLRLLKRPELGVTFTKLHCWRLTQFEKCVFLDADTMVLANADELFDREEFSAAPDVGWPDCFNSGVFVYRPSEETYNKLIQFAIERGSFDGGDQGLLNLYFSDWAHKDISKHLPFIYNMCSTACYSYLPAFKQFGPTVKIIHFIGNTKPWLQYFDTETQHVQVVSDIQHLQGVVQQWWNIFCSCIHPMLSPTMPTSRAPTAAHFPSYPKVGRSFHQNSSPDNSFSSVEETKSDYRNVFDPWEEYENKLESTDYHHEHTNSASHSENSVIDNAPESSHNSHQSTVKLEQTVITNISTNNNFSDNAHTYIKETDVDCTVSDDRHDFDFSNNQSSNHSHAGRSFQPSSPKINTPSSTTDPALECNQLARPHECEPTSSVINENALHDHPNEVHDGSAGLAGAFARLTIGAPRTPEQAMLEDQLRRQGWEVGNIDYMGRDSFDNIWSKICETLEAGPVVPSYDPLPPADPAPSVAAELIAAKQVLTELAQPITNVTEQKTGTEKEQLELIPEKSSQTVIPTTDPSVTIATLLPPPSCPSVVEPTVTAPELVVPASKPVVPMPEAIVSESVSEVPASGSIISAPKTVDSAPEPVVSVPEPAVSAPELSVPVPKPTDPSPESIVPASTPVVPPSEPSVPSSQAAIPEPEVPVPQQTGPALEPKPTGPALGPIVSSLESVVPTPAPVVQAFEQFTPALQAAVPASQPSDVGCQAVPAPQVPIPSSQTVVKTPPPAAPIAKPVAPHPESPKPDSVTELPISQPPKPTTDPPKKQPEPTPPPAPKSKSEKPASQAGDATKAVTESVKPSINVPKHAPEQASGQKSSPTKEAAQSKAEATSAEGPIPPPRKGASGQAAGGGKKSAKGKK